MNRFSIFDFFADEMASAWRYHLVLGLMSVLFGIFILLFPVFLVAMIAGFFVLTGLALLRSAWKGYRFRKHYYQDVREDFLRFFS